MFKKLTITCVVVIISFTLMTCKKYPENTLWFKNPTGIPVMEGYITSYVVNGIDSLNLLNYYYAPVQPSSSGPYNSTSRDIKREFFNTYTSHANEIGCDLGRGNYKWSDNKKKISVFFYPDVEYYKKKVRLHLGKV